MDIFSELITLDGGFSTELQTVDGFEIESDHLWGARSVINNPDATIRVHKRFLDAGARLILTNSYSATIPRLTRNDGMTLEEAQGVLQKTVKLARKAVDLYSKENPNSKKIYVGASIGSFANSFDERSDQCFTGAYMETADLNEIYKYYLDQAKTLSEAGVDLLCFETIPALEEAKVVLKVLDALPNSFAWIAFSCKDGKHLGHSETFSDAVGAVSGHQQVAAVGINCSDPNFVTSLLHSAKDHRNGKPFILYPNTGEVYKYEDGGGTWHRPNEKSQAVEDYVSDWVALGAKAIGGCCRVYASDIAKISKAMNKLSSSN